MRYFKLPARGNRNWSDLHFMRDAIVQTIAKAEAKFITFFFLEEGVTGCWRIGKETSIRPDNIKKLELVSKYVDTSDLKVGFIHYLNIYLNDGDLIEISEVDVVSIFGEYPNEYDDDYFTHKKEIWSSVAQYLDEKKSEWVKLDAGFSLIELQRADDITFEEWEGIK